MATLYIGRLFPILLSVFVNKEYLQSDRVIIFRHMQKDEPEREVHGEIKNHLDSTRRNYPIALFVLTLETHSGIYNFSRA